MWSNVITPNVLMFQSVFFMVLGFGCQTAILFVRAEHTTLNVVLVYKEYYANSVLISR